MCGNRGRPYSSTGAMPLAFPAPEYPITLKGVSRSMAMYCGYVAGQNAVNGI